MSSAESKKKKEAFPQSLSTLMFDAACQIADKINARAVFLNADALDHSQITEKTLKNAELILIARSQESFDQAIAITQKVLHVPAVDLTRMAQIKLAVLMGLSAEMVNREDKIVCLSQNHLTGSLDSIVVVDIGKEFEIITSSDLAEDEKKIRHDVFEAVLSIALELATEGREGKPVGTLFVISDHDKVMELSRQLIINPFKGYPEDERNVLDLSLRDTIKEFAAIDGAFVVSDKGILMAAGRHLSASLEDEDFPQGLGSRHLAAAGITGVTKAVAITVSESTGTVRIFKEGKILVEIERMAGRRRIAKQRLT